MIAFMAVMMGLGLLFSMLFRVYKLLSWVEGSGPTS